MLTFTVKELSDKMAHIHKVDPEAFMYYDHGALFAVFESQWKPLQELIQANHMEPCTDVMIHGDGVRNYFAEDTYYKEYKELTSEDVQHLETKEHVLCRFILHA